MAELSSVDIDEQIAKLLKIKQEREETKKLAESYIEENKDRSVKLQYYEAETFEILMSLHDTYDLKYDFSLILHRAIEEEDLIFATKLILSDLIDGLFICWYQCHGNGNCNHFPINNELYFWNTFELAIKKDDLDRVQLLEKTYITRQAIMHRTVNSVTWTKLTGVSEYEDSKIRILVVQSTKCTSNDHHHYFRLENVGSNIKNHIISTLPSTENDGTIEFLLRKCKNSSGCIEVGDEFKKILVLHVNRWIREKNHKMLQFAVDNTTLPNHRKIVVREMILEYIRDHDQEVLAYDLDWYKKICELMGNTSDIGCGNPIDVWSLGRHYKTTNIDVFKHVLTEDTNRILLRTDANDRLRWIQLLNRALKNIIYNAKKDRLDIYEYLIEIYPIAI
jgi:hypothetical protein